MNKVKWSFSLLLAFFIVGILSTAAFASDLYSLKAVQKDSGLDVSFNGNTYTDPADVEGTEFDVVLKYGSDEIKTYKVALDSANHGKTTIPSGDLKSGKTYKIQLFHSDDNSHSTMLSGIVVADVNGSGLLNANETGQNNTNKSRTGQKVHGAYQNNTNSCASCHQTHGASDNNLLLKDGVYSTCSACHDGTTGSFNYFSDTTATKTAGTISGTFNVSADVAHGSLHQADGTLQISSAPGANRTPNNTAKTIDASTYGQDFDCASCHAPHGAGSADENNLNIDPLGWGGVQYYPVGATKDDGTTATKDDANGKLFKGITVQDSVPLIQTTPFILVRLTAAASDISTDKSKIGYLYSRAGVNVGDTVIQTYRWDGSKYIRDYSLWLRDTGYKPKPFKNANTVFYNDSGKAINVADANMTYVWRDGFAFGTDAANVKTADISLGIDVETNGDITSLYDSKSANYIPDSGIEMAKYCAACHTDYLVDPVTGKVGVMPTKDNPNAQSHRHRLSDSFSCVRCHFAHGTNSSIMKESYTATSPGTTEDTLSSVTHSSALRRYTDMNACYAGCHHSPGQFDSSPTATIAGTTSNTIVPTDGTTTSNTTNTTTGSTAGTVSDTTTGTASGTSSTTTTSGGSGTGTSTTDAVSGTSTNTTSGTTSDTTTSSTSGTATSTTTTAPAQ